MAWDTVVVGYGKNTFLGMKRGNEVQVSSLIGNPKTIKIDGVSVSVLEGQEDIRGEFLTLTIDCQNNESAVADQKEEVSDDEPIEGRDND